MLGLNADGNPCFLRMGFIYFGGQGGRQREENVKYKVRPRVIDAGVKRISRCRGKWGGSDGGSVGATGEGLVLSSLGEKANFRGVILSSSGFRLGHLSQIVLLPRRAGFQGQLFLLLQQIGWGIEKAPLTLIRRVPHPHPSLIWKPRLRHLTPKGDGIRTDDRPSPAEGSEKPHQTCIFVYFLVS